MISQLLSKIGNCIHGSNAVRVLDEEGIVFQRPWGFVTLKFHAFRAPLVLACNKIKIKHCAVFVTRSRFYVTGWLFRVVNIPLDRNHARFYTVTLEGNTIEIHIACESFSHLRRGAISVKFSSDQASQLATYIESLQRL